MMRKTSVILLSAATGAALTLFVTQPRAVLMGSSARAATSDTYRQLNLFGDVFERVRSDYVEKPDDSKLVEIRHHRHAGRPRSAFQLHGRQEFPRHAGADPRRVRRARHRGHDGRRPDQGGLADRRHAGVQGRHHGQRHHHQSRRRSGAGPHPQPGGREDARPGQHQDPASRSSARARTTRSTSRWCATTSASARCARRVEGDDIGYIRITTFNEQTTEGLKREIGNLSDADRRQAEGLHHRPEQQSRRLAGGGGDGFRRLPRARRDRLDPRPQCRGNPAPRRASGRPDQGQADDRADQWRLGLGVGNRRRRAAGPQARDAGRHALVRQGLGADHHSARRGNGALRLTTARYFTPSGKSIQAKGIVPDIEVLQDVPDELKSRTDTKGEASLRGHLKIDGDEKTGSQSYVPPDAKDDKALKMADDLLHGIKTDRDRPPDRRQGRDRQAGQQGARTDLSSSSIEPGRPLGRAVLRGRCKRALPPNKAVASCRAGDPGRLSDARLLRRASVPSAVVSSARLIRGGSWRRRPTI